jgi:hypothetical protein
MADRRQRPIGVSVIVAVSGASPVGVDVIDRRILLEDAHLNDRRAIVAAVAGFDCAALQRLVIELIDAGADAVAVGSPARRHPVRVANHPDGVAKRQGEGDRRRWRSPTPAAQ